MMQGKIVSKTIRSLVLKILVPACTGLRWLNKQVVTIYVNTLTAAELA